MPTFDSESVPIHYIVIGTGQPIILVHGFASSFARNWLTPGWADFLAGNGSQVIGLDVRGHGESGKPYQPEAYRAENMSGDVLRLLDHLNIPQADLMGYSMGAGIALYLTAYHGARFRKVILGGIGDGAIAAHRETVHPNVIAAAMATDDPLALADPVARQFRTFAERGGNDLKALAAVARRPRTPSDPEAVRRIAQPVLIVVGADDVIAGGAQKLAAAIPYARLVVIPNRNHLTVVGDQRYKDAVRVFLQE
jgi:pimeloyl-ACP methyl ester carboxylesterase